MSDSTPPSVPKGRSRSRFRFGFDAVVTGLSLGVSMVLAMMWWHARHEVGSLHESIVPLREEVERYRAGLREEVLRTHKLSEDLKAARNKTASAH